MRKLKLVVVVVVPIGCLSTTLFDNTLFFFSWIGNSTVGVREIDMTVQILFRGSVVLLSARITDSTVVYRLLRPLEISAVSLSRRDAGSVTKEAPSTGSSPVLWCREATSPGRTAVGESLSTGWVPFGRGAVVSFSMNAW